MGLAMAKPWEKVSYIINIIGICDSEQACPKHGRNEESQQYDAIILAVACKELLD